MNGRAIYKDEENSTIEATIAELNNEIALLRAKEKPLEVELEKLQAMSEAFEEELNLIKRRLEELETDHFLYIYHLNHKMKENKHPTEASTSEGLAADLS